MINVPNITKLDLNLLVVFHCLMIERSVTRTSTILHLTQGAVSSALKRLREQFGDELFSRSGEGMMPTRRALDLAPKIAEALTAVSAIAGKGSNLSTEVSRRAFNIALSDDIESYLSPKLADDPRAQELGVTFAFHQTNSILWKKALSESHMDVVLCSEPKEMTSQYSSRILFSSSYSCIFDGPRLKLKSPLTRDEFLRHDHIRVSFDGRRSFVDDLLEKEGIQRRVRASVTHFGGILPMLAFSSAIATIPTFAAHSYARIARLTVSPVPIYVPSFRVFMVWPVQKSADMQNQWLRNFIVDLTQELPVVTERRAPGIRKVAKPPR
jgi:LysR family transcriptional activator of mexEF-oprN operon